MDEDALSKQAANYYQSDTLVGSHPSKLQIIFANTIMEELTKREENRKDSQFFCAPEILIMAHS